MGGVDKNVRYRLEQALENSIASQFVVRSTDAYPDRELGASKALATSTLHE